MFTFAIRVKGLEKLPQKIKRFRVGINARISLMLAQIGQEVAGIAREKYLSGRPGLKRVSGDLARSISEGPNTLYKVSGNRVVIGTNLPYGRIHEYGGKIAASSAPYLHFLIPGVGYRKAKSVVIPARPYLRPAMKDAVPGARKIIARLANDALREALAGG